MVKIGQIYKSILPWSSIEYEVLEVQDHTQSMTLLFSSNGKVFNKVRVSLEYLDHHGIYDRDKTINKSFNNNLDDIFK